MAMIKELELRKEEFKDEVVQKRILLWRRNSFGLDTVEIDKDNSSSLIVIIP